MRRRLMLAAAFVVLFGLGWWVGRGGAASDLYGQLDLFIEVLHRVEDNYVDEVEPRQLIDGALRGMLRDLDPYSQYLDARAFEGLQEVTHGSFGGIGIVVSVRNHFPTVVSPIEGSPAWEAGLRSGDIIVEIEGKSSFDLTVEDAADLLRGPEGTKVSIVIRREGQSTDLPVTLTRRVIETKSVPYAFMTTERVGYLRLANFSERSGQETREAIESLRKQGAKSLVLDLRLNPGGLLDQAVDVAEQFLPKGSLVVYTEGRAKSQANRYLADEARPELKWPIVVLIDGGSASASEIVAGALQDMDRALLLGRTSFGKGSVQSVFPLAGNRAALKLTTAVYHTPSGRSIHKPHTSAGDLDPFALEEDPGAPAPDGAPPGDDADGMAERPAFRTASGRTVYGGGGITPDAIVRQDSLPAPVLEAERLSLPFRFANRLVNAKEIAPAAARVDDATWRAFVAFVAAEAPEVDAGALNAHRTLLDRALRRELARRLLGDGEAARVALEGDTVFQRALGVLRTARAPGDVFAADGAADGTAATGR